MITPMMHILSSMDEKYRVGHPVNILYLNRDDRDLVISEAKNIGARLNNENKVWITDSPTGERMVADTQVVVDESVSLNPYTALLLTRVLECFKVYSQEVDETDVEEVNDDLSTDAVVLRLEGTPRYIYVFVYNVMETPSLSYDAKIAKLSELLHTLQTHSVVLNSEETDPRMRKTLNRMELHSKLSYWKRMLMQDYMRVYGTAPPGFTAETIEIIRRDLANMGFYGFVNPLQMYREFNTSRVSRKVSIDVEDFVMDFLTKVVRSGGGAA